MDVLPAADAVESFRLVPALLPPSIEVRESLVLVESGELSADRCCRDDAVASGANILSTDDGCVEEDSDTALSTDGNRKAPSLLLLLLLLRVGDGEVV